MKTQTMLSANLFFVATMFLLLLNSVEGGDNVRCREKERRALLEFKAGVVDERGILSSWGNNNSNECCNWRGIRCSNLTDHVTVLNLPASNSSDTWLSGEVSLSLSELKHLKYLNLGRNPFSNETLPHPGNLTNLLYLKNLDWVSNLRMLTHLDLSYVNLCSCNDWLNQIYKLSSLTHLNLAACYLPDQFLPSYNTSFSAFNSLVVLDLSRNNFVSPWSYNWLINFTSTLVYLDLSGNSLSRIPEAFGRIVSLESLILTDCELEGKLPDSFTNLSRLATLKLNHNNFNGPLSEFLQPLATKENNALQVLNLGGNQLHGSLPDYITRFLSLREMLIPGNKLDGTFLDSFGQFSSSLVHVDLSNNQITGPLLNLTLFSSLEILDLHNNKLEGRIPEAYLSNLDKLNYLDLSYNSLSMNFGFDWVPPFQLDTILLQNCTLGPHFPNWIKSQRNFSVLDISHAGIFGRIPIWFWDHLPSKVEYLSLSGNSIEGVLPDLSLMFNAANYIWLDLRSNRLTGPIPPIPSNMGTLDLSQNMFTGSLSFLCTTPSKFIGCIDLSDNQLSGELPDCFMNVPDLSILILANNNLSGMIPSSIALLYNLNTLQLYNNNFHGEFPSALKNCTRLTLLNLSKNKFSGEVPVWVGKYLPSLVVFSLCKNEFSGTIPAEICLLRNVNILDFSRNEFSGSIPNCINNITSLIEGDDPGAIYKLKDRVDVRFSYRLTYFLNAAVLWKGVVSEYRNTLGLLKLIDLSCNRLIGEIPNEFASLKELIALNLSRNSLTGNIIQEIGEMKSLEVLDLSRNQLFGEIPTSLASLTLLSVLDLSNNDLSGHIPTSTQLQSFDASMYAGNEQLCGLPLSKCGDIVSSPNGHDKEDEINEGDEDRLSKIGLYASVILGFATGFWGFVCPTMLRRTQRRGYNRLLDKIADQIYVITALNMARLQRKIYG